jgi:hypothetical protein
MSIQSRRGGDIRRHYYLYQTSVIDGKDITASAQRAAIPCIRIERLQIVAANIEPSRTTIRTRWISMRE